MSIVSTKHYFGEDAQKRLVKGAEELAKVVGVTLSVRGLNVALGRFNPVNNEQYEEIVVHDGVTIAKEVRPKDRVEAFGADMLKQAAQRQVDLVGDGTTLVTILGAAIVREAFKIISAGTNPMSLRNGLEEAQELVIKELDKLAIPIKTEQEKVQVATISSGNAELGEMIGKLLHKIGPEGVVTVEESQSSTTELDHQEGMQFDKGYVVQHFITNPQRMEATIEDTFILLTDKALNNGEDILPMLQAIHTLGKRRIVVIAADLGPGALGTLVKNKVEGSLQTLAIKAPSFADKQKEFLRDIAILTGGRVMSEDEGTTWEEFNDHWGDYLGKAQRVTSLQEQTLIVGGQGDKKEIKERVAALRKQLGQLRSEFDKDKVRERIAKLSGGVAVIRVGGHTEVEMRERKERAIDAVAATKAAIEEGILAGGEMGLYRAREVLKEPVTNDTAKLSAYKILYDALEKPLAKLLENGGFELGEYKHDLREASLTSGVDVTDGQVKDMVQSGIIDPVKVPKAAVANAVSVAIQIMTTGAIVVPSGEEVKIINQ